MYSKLSQELRAALSNQAGDYEFRKWRSASNKLLKKKIEEIKIPGFDSIHEKIWALWNNTFTRPKCWCGSSTTLIDHRRFRVSCSVKCAANDPIRRSKTKETELKRYGGHHFASSKVKDEIRKNSKENGKWPGSFGTNAHKAAIQKKYKVDNVFQAEEIKTKIKATLIERYGADNPLMVEVIKKKVQGTNLQRYGATSPLGSQEIKKKIKQALLENYGVDNPLKSEVVRDKIKKTNLERYSVEHVLQDSTIFERCMQNQVKARYKYKELTLPSGRIVNYQGYEGYVINYLLEAGVAEADLILERLSIPVIAYEFEGRKRRYYPDIFIKSKNMLIEVKSTYTFDRETGKNLAKQSAAKTAGFHHLIIVWDVSKNCILEVY